MYVVVLNLCKARNGRGEAATAQRTVAPLQMPDYYVVRSHEGVLRRGRYPKPFLLRVIGLFTVGPGCPGCGYQHLLQQQQQAKMSKVHVAGHCEESAFGK